MKVSFIIGGFQKCGTTALFDFLTSHPKVIGSNPKELDFFNYSGNYKHGEKYYHSMFKPRPILANLRGYKYLEASPSYASDGDIEQTARRIYNYNPKIKIILVVRNPVDRAFSAWNMYKKNYEKGNVNWWFDWVQSRTDKEIKATRRTPEEYKNFTLFIQNEIISIEQNQEIECNILSNGLYSKGIKTFLKIFKENLLVISNENLNKDTYNEMNKISNFLGLPEHDWNTISNKKVFKGNYNSEMSNLDKEILSNYYKSSNKELFDITNILYH